jgi:hypothetical protein
MPLLILLPAAPGASNTNAPVSTWRYSLACFACMTSVVGIAMYVKSRWGYSAPGFFGLVGGVISVSVAGFLFVNAQRREPCPIERRRLTIGCLLAFWFYDEFLRIAVMLAHREETARKILTAVEATVFDLVLVWGIIRCILLWAAQHYRVHDTESPPNNRWWGA